MLEAVSLKSLLSRPNYPIPNYWFSHFRWKREDNVALKLLLAHEVSPDRASLALGRPPSAIAWHAHETQLVLPKFWRSLIRPTKGRAERVVDLQYPYLVDTRGQYSDLLAVNALVPRSIPPHLRADICQQIMLEIQSGNLTLADLQQNAALIRKLSGQAKTANYESGGYAMSLDAPMPSGRSWYDIMPDGVEQEW